MWHYRIKAKNSKNYLIDSVKITNHKGWSTYMGAKRAGDFAAKNIKDSWPGMKSVLLEVDVYQSEGGNGINN